jgi:hypothetical protein
MKINTVGTAVGNGENVTLFEYNKTDKVIKKKLQSNKHN